MMLLLLSTDSFQESIFKSIFILLQSHLNGLFRVNICIRTI